MTERLLLAGMIGFGSGIAARSLMNIGWEFLVFLLVLGLLSTGAALASRVWLYAFFAIVFTLFASGALRVSLVPDTYPSSFAPLVDAPATLTGTIAADPDIRETNQRVPVDVVEGGEHAKILVVTDLNQQYSYGEEVTVSGTLTKPKPFDTDGGRIFTYDKFLAKDSIFLMMGQGTIEVRAPAQGLFTRLQAELYDVKHLFEAALSRALPEPYASLAVGLIAGGKQGLGMALLAVFTVAGLLPIVVLSGYNVMIVAEAILRVLGFLPKRVALVVAAFAIVAFVCAAGAGSSALRAGLMALLALFARATGRTYDALRALLFVLILMLIMNPLLFVYDPGFQFSFIATLGLIIGSPLVALRLAWIKTAFLREIVATTIAAQVFVLPLLLYQTGNLSLVAVPANVLVLPVVPLAMLLAFIAGLVALVFPPLAALVGLPAYAFLWYIIAVAKGAASLPLAQVILPAFPFGIVVILYVLLALLIRHMQTSVAPEGAALVPHKPGATPSPSRDVLRS